MRRADMLYTAVSTLFSHWRRHPGQLATLMLGLALATALWSGVQAINAEARASYDRAAATLGQDRLDRLVTADGTPVALADYVALRRLGYQVSPVMSGVLTGDGARLRLLGVDPLTAPPEAQAPELGGDGSVGLDALFGTPGVLLVNAETAAAPLPPDLPPLAIQDTVPPGAAITDIATAARLLGQIDPSYLLVHTQQPAGLPPLDSAIALQRIGPRDGTDIASLTDSFHLNLTAFGLLSFAVGLFIVHGAVGLAFEQRRAMFRTLRALGLPLRSLVAAFSLELAGLALISGLAGLAMGYGLAALLMPGVAGTLSGLYGASVSGGLTFDPVWALAGLAMTLAGAALAGGQAIVKLVRLSILAPAQPRAWALASRRTMRVQTVLALGLAGIGGALALFGDGLIMGFGLLAALLLAAALMLPGTLALILRAAAGTARGPFAEWLLADTRQQLPSLSLALMALLLALAANVGVSTMVGSFRGTFVGWLDQRLASELYVTASDPAQSRDLQAFLQPRADAVLPIISAGITLDETPVEVFGIADHATYRDHWPLLAATERVWDDIALSNGILINEQLARRGDIGLGDTIPLRAGVTLPVVGIYSDYGNPAGQAIIGIALFDRLFPDVPLTRFALRVPPEDAAALAAALRDDFGLPPDAVVNQDQVKRFSLQVFEQTFRITGALNVLTLGVAATALLTSLLTLASLRLPQLAPVWAIGVTRARLARFELLRSLILAALTFVLALPVGLMLAWVLLAVVNVEAFGWRLPMQVFPRDWAVLFGMALVAAALAAAWPARRLARMSPNTLLKVFSHDR